MTSRRQAVPLFSALLLGLALVPQAGAQLSVDAPAPSRVIDGLTLDVPVISLPAVDTAALLAEDAVTGRSGPMRYGATIPLEIDVKQLGLVEALPDGGTLYRLGFSSLGALSLGVEFSDYELPLGAGLWVHAGDGSETLGSYTLLNNKASGEFAITPVADDALVIEYVEPAGVEFPGRVVVSGLVHAYRDVLGKGGPAYSAAGSCNVDVNCPQGLPYQNQKRAVARILSGGFLCSGQLVNNTANDGTQYFWTASHCGSMNNAIFLFNYEKSGCGSGSAPSNQSVQGSVLVSTNSNNDHRLVRITENIPNNYNVYYLGWNRSTSAPSNTVSIHHPSGDVKKISFDNNPPQKNSVYWRILEWDLGVTEGGSSGGCLMDPQGRMIGQLCCGAAACGYLFDDYYGRFELAWSAVASTLDPIGSGATAIGGFDPDVPVGNWANLGGGVGGLLGTPVLTGTGSMAAGSTVTLALAGAIPSGTTNLVVGLSLLGIPFKGGVLVPNPDVVIPGLPLSGSGTHSVSATWPAGIPSGTRTWYQHWVQDFTGPQGLAASNGLRGTTP